MRVRLRQTIRGVDETLIRAMRRLSVKARFVALVLCISILPILVIGIASYAKANADIIEKTGSASLQLVSKIGANLDQQLSDYAKYGDLIAISKTVQDVLKAHMEPGIYQDPVSVRALESIMKESLKVSLELQEPVIITAADEIISPVSNTQPFVNNFEPAQRERIMRRMQEANGSNVWNTDDVLENGYLGNIVIARSIRDIETFKRSIGFLLLQVSSAPLYDVCLDVNLGKGSTILLLDERGLILSSNAKSRIGTFFSGAVLDAITAQELGGVERAILKRTDPDHLVAFSRIPTTGWTVLALIPNTYMNSLSHDILRMVFCVGLVCLVVSLVLFSLVYRSITLPLGELIDSMRQVRVGHADLPDGADPVLAGVGTDDAVTGEGADPAGYGRMPDRTPDGIGTDDALMGGAAGLSRYGRMPDHAQDEVGEVIDSYRRMIVELNGQVERIKAKEKQKAEAEFRALQAQINPHFMANTLNSIAWMAKMQKADNIETVSTSLIQLLNASMGRDGDLVSVCDEMRNIEHYVTIMRYRYVKEIDVTFDVDPGIADSRILRFILQPIVENAIIHGLAPKQGPGFITIKGYAEGETLVLIVTDTGVGLGEAEIRRLMDSNVERRDHFTRIGLRNIHDRIRLSYGGGFGLFITGQIGLFTAVQVRMPVIRQEESA